MKISFCSEGSRAKTTTGLKQRQSLPGRPVIGQQGSENGGNGPQFIDEGSHLTNLQFTLVEIALEHALFGATPPQKSLQFLDRGTALLGLLHLLKEAVAQQAHRRQLLQLQKGIPFSRSQGVALKGLMGRRLFRQSKGRPNLYAIGPQGHRGAHVGATANASGSNYRQFGGCTNQGYQRHGGGFF